MIFFKSIIAISADAIHYTDATPPTNRSIEIVNPESGSVFIETQNIFIQSSIDNENVVIKGEELEPAPTVFTVNGEDETSFNYEIT